MRPKARKSGCLCVNMRFYALMTRGALLGNTLLKETNKVSLIFEKVSETNVMQIINNLPNKNSCGFDGISTIEMKSIKHVILNHLLY